jgi:hypothetical protein
MAEVKRDFSRKLPSLGVVLATIVACVPVLASVPTPTPTPTPRPSVRVPQKAQWESNMKTWGQKHCDHLKAVTAVAALGTTYYDAEKVYLQIGEYTKNPAKWQPCADAAKRSYRDSYVMRSDVMGGVPGYWNFSNGLVLDWKAAGAVDCAAEPKPDACKSKDAVNALATKGAFCATGVPLDWTKGAHVSREAAYCVRALDDSETVGSAASARKGELLDQMLGPGGHFDQWLTGQAIAPSRDFDGPAQCASKNYFQPFMAGISMNVAIQIWERSHDPRILTAVKALADFTWTQGWDPDKKAFWYDNCSAPGTLNWMLPRSGSPDLNLMIAPAFAWLWKQTGEDKYRVQGDQIWESGVVGAYIEQAKQFNQNYSESFNYLKWREGQ